MMLSTKILTKPEKLTCYVKLERNFLLPLLWFLCFEAEKKKHFADILSNIFTTIQGDLVTVLKVCITQHAKNYV